MAPQLGWGRPRREGDLTSRVDATLRKSPKSRHTLPTIKATMTDRPVKWTKPNRDKKKQ